MIIKAYFLYCKHMEHRKSRTATVLNILAIISLLIGAGFIVIGPQCVDVVNTPIAAVGFPFIALSIALYIWARIASKTHKGPSSNCQ